MLTEQHLNYILQLADNSLILGHRNSEWTGHGPILEQDIAISNIALDLVGQSRYFYQHAAAIKGNGATEDTLAYHRDAGDFKNCLLVELKNGDWARSILRLYFFSTYQYFLYRDLQHSKDEVVAAIAEKAWKEASYHMRWSGEWVIRLGDGTEESHTRIENALVELWPYTGELMMPAIYELALVENGLAIDPASLKDPWLSHVNEVFQRALLQVPANAWMQSGGKEGRHTEHLGYILAEMQYLQRVYPGNEW